VVAMLVAVPVWAASDPSRQAEATTADYERLDADNTYDLAIDIARQIADGDLARLSDLIIATGEHPTDAIVSAGLAGYLDTCPRPDGQACNRTATLLTRPDTLPQAVADAIAASGVPADRITLLGGTTAITDDVHRQIATTAGWNGTGANPVVRVAGATRYDTATAIATHITGLATRPGGLPLPASYRTIIVANGDQPADALAASTLAYRSGHLLLLASSHGTLGALDTAIDTLDAHCALVIGGTNALPASLDSRLTDALATTGTGTCTPERIAGTDRHHTATLIASQLTQTHGSAMAAFITNPGAHPLPLTAAPLTRANNVVLYTRTEQLPTTTRDWLDQHPTITRITAAGPETSVSPAVASRALDTTITTPPATGGGASGGGFSLAYATTEFLTSTTSQTLTPTVTGGTGPYTYAITNGTLPTGVTFNTTTGAFTGPSTWNLGFVTVSVGRHYSCGILTDTTARCWGNGGDGQRGDGTNGVSLHPVAILASGTPTTNPVTLSGITQISAGLAHTCLVLADTTARCFGWNGDGALGDGTMTGRYNPVTVLASGTQASNPVTLSGVTQISVGYLYACTLMVDTTARCWGFGGYGNLGDGTSAARLNPVAVLASGDQSASPVTLSGITRIATTVEHTCAVLADTTARCWGASANGKLGNGLSGWAGNNPVRVLASGTEAGSPVPLTGVTDISGAELHTCAALADGGARCWGYSQWGLIGDGTENTTRLNPVRVLAAGTEASNPVVFGGSITLAPTTVTVTVTDSTAATTTRVVTLTSA